MAQAPAVRPAPAMAPTMMAPFTVVNAIVPKDIEGGVFMSLGGAAVASLAGLLPDDIKPVGVVGGVALAGLGVYKLFDYFFGGPKTESASIPPQPTVDIADVKGEILVPADGGSAELSSMWTVFWQSNRTYKISFQITNNSPAELTLPIEFAVEERKTILPNKTTRATYVVKLPGKKDGMQSPREIVTGWQPISAVLMGGIDAVGTLVLKGPTSTEDKVLDTVKFSI